MTGVRGAVRKRGCQQSHQDLPWGCFVRRSLISRAASFGRSFSLTAMNLSPTPAPGTAWRMTASARICPSWTRKSSLARTPAGLGLSVSMNSPAMLRSRTRDTSSCPLHCQQTHTSPAASTREVNRLEGEVPGPKLGSQEATAPLLTARLMVREWYYGSVKERLIVSPG
jgi:hypothetical protein